MEHSQRREIAERLAAAYGTKQAIPRFSNQFPEMTIDDAYEIQQIQTDQRVARGATIRGHKVGLTSLAMQKQIGVNQPDYGVLFEDMFYYENSDIPTSNFLQPKVEPEVAFILKESLIGPNINVADAASAVEWVLPALELIDSRVENWNISFFDTIGDNASSAGVVLGTSVRTIQDMDLRLMGCNLRKDGEMVHTGAGGAVLGSPLTALAWLANTLGERGIPLEAGQIILPGSITKAVSVVAGNTISVDFAGLGSLTARFV